MTQGFRPQDLQAARAAKAASRGGFGARIVWMGNQTEVLSHRVPGPYAPEYRADLEAGQ